METQLMGKIADKALLLFEEGETKESLSKELQESGIEINEQVMVAINTAWTYYQTTKKAEINILFERKLKNNKYYYRIRSVTQWMTEKNMDSFLCDSGMIGAKATIHEEGKPAGTWIQETMGHRILGC